MTTDPLMTVDLAGVEHWAEWRFGNRAVRTGTEFTPRQGPGRLIFDEVTHAPGQAVVVRAHSYGRGGLRADHTLALIDLDTAVIHRKRELQP